MSGGPDSLALLVLACHAGLEVTAVHVDHGLRPGSGAEAAVVEDAAARFGARFQSVAVGISEGPNLEARARAARRGALPAEPMTGHTADDQAETVLLNLLRGSGLDGLAGMRPGPTKPILGLRRVETHELCRLAGLDPVVDPSNRDLRHRRNRVRLELLPLAAAIAERDVAAVIARQAALVRDDAELLDVLAGELDPSDARAVATAPVALARRAVRRWLTDVTGLDHPPDAASVERVLAVARGDRAACEVPGGWRVRRSHQRLSVEEPRPDSAP